MVSAPRPSPFPPPRALLVAPAGAQTPRRRAYTARARASSRRGGAGDPRQSNAGFGNIRPLRANGIRIRRTEARIRINVRAAAAASSGLMGHSLQGMKRRREKNCPGAGARARPSRANGAERAWRRARRAGAGGGRIGARPNAEREPRDRRRGGARARRAMFRRGAGAKSGHDGARRATEQAPRVELAEWAGSAAESAAEAPTPGGGAAGSASRSMVCVGVLRAGRRRATHRACPPCSCRRAVLRCASADT